MIHSCCCLISMRPLGSDLMTCKGQDPDDHPSQQTLRDSPLGGWPGSSALGSLGCPSAAGITSPIDHPSNEGSAFGSPRPPGPTKETEIDSGSFRTFCGKKAQVLDNFSILKTQQEGNNSINPTTAGSIKATQAKHQGSYATVWGVTVLEKGLLMSLHNS